MLGAPTQPHTHRALRRLQGSGMCCSQPAQQFSIVAPDRCVVYPSRRYAPPVEPVSYLPTNVQ